MFVYRPIKSNYFGQGFGDRLACGQIQPNLSIRVVAKVNNICPAGYQDLYTDILGMKGHSGEDWSLWMGEPIYFPCSIDGMKWWAKTEVDSAGGIGVDVISKEKVNLGDYDGYIKLRFWHLQKVAVHDGQEIILGQIIGFGDNTGLSGGSHLHWALKECDQSGIAINKANGYFGARTFRPWFVNKFVTDFLKEEADRKYIEVQVKEVQLTFIQLLHKYIFLLQQQIQTLAKGLGGLFK